MMSRHIIVTSQKRRDYRLCFVDMFSGSSTATLTMSTSQTTTESTSAGSMEFVSKLAAVAIQFSNEDV